MAATADHQNHQPNCMDDPNFATICSFLENFGETCHIAFIPFDKLQSMLEDTTKVDHDLAQIHILLLRRIYKSINTEKWEKHLTKFCHSYNSQDAWEVERFGYKKSKIQTKLRLLKNLMESQFDYNIKFKNEVNKLTADNLRRIPMGRDSEGQLYWYQVDAEANLRIYREDVDDDTWELVATSREEMTQLIHQLTNGIVHKNSVDGESGGGEGEGSPKEEDLVMEKGGDLGDYKGSSDPCSSSDEDAMAIDEDAPVGSGGEEEEGETEEVDKMDTADLGKTVRQMLDNSIPVEEAKIPEIKQEDDGSKTQEISPVVPTFDEKGSDSVKPDPEFTLPIHDEIQVQDEEKAWTLSSQDEADSQPEASADKNEEPELFVQDTARPTEESSEVQVQNEIPAKCSMGGELSLLVPMPVSPPVEEGSEEIETYQETPMAVEAGLSGFTTGKPEPVPLPQVPQPDVPPVESETEAPSSSGIEENEGECLPETVPAAEEIRVFPNPCESSDVPLPAPPAPVQGVVLATVTESFETISAVVQLGAIDQQPSLPDDNSEMEISQDESSEQDLSEPPESSCEVERNFFTDLDQSVELDASEFPSFEENQSEVKELGQNEFAAVGEESGMEASQSISNPATSPPPAAAADFDAHFVSEEASAVVVSKGQAEVSPLHQTSDDGDGDSALKPTDTENSATLPATDASDNEIFLPPPMSVEAAPEAPVSLPGTTVNPSRTSSEEGERNFEIVEPEADFLSSSPLNPKPDEDGEEPELKPSTSPKPAEEILEGISENLPLGSPELEGVSPPRDKLEINDDQLLETGTEIKEGNAGLSESSPSFSEHFTEPVEPEPITEDLNQPISPIPNSCESIPGIWHEEAPVGVPEVALPETTMEEPMGLDSTEIFKPEMENKLSRLEDESTTPTCEELISPDDKNDLEGPNSPLPEEPMAEIHEPIPVVEDVISKSTAWLTGDDVNGSDLKISDSIPTSSNNEGLVLEEPPPPPPPAQIPLQREANPRTTASIPTPYVEKPEKAPEKPKSLGLLGLVGYADTSEEEEEEEEAPQEKSIPPLSQSQLIKGSTEVTSSPKPTDELNEVSCKRRAESPPLLEHPSKCSKMEKEEGEKRGDLNSIVGETIEEEMVLIVGEGSGAELEGGNSPIPQGLNSTAESVEDDGESSLDETPVAKKGPGRPRGRKPGSGRGGRPTKRGGGGGGGGRRGKQKSPEKDESSNESPAPASSSKKKVNGRLSTEIPTRQSSRIAKIQEKEEEERRRLEEERLAQLKAAQLKKQQRQLEREQKQESGDGPPPPKSGKGKGRPPKSESKYLPTPSGTESDDEDLQTAIQQSKKRGRKRKHGEPPRTLMKKGLNPWVHSSSEDEDEGVEEEEEEHDVHEEEEEDLTLRSDHEFSPESDMGEDDEASPSRHARTVKRGETKEDKYAETNCSKCGKGDHPEWILLCDSCDVGWHASCLRPVTWVIPEGSWFCPPCQHKMLIDKLNENLEEYDKVVKKHELEVLRKQRLAFVGISLDNVLPQQEGEGVEKAGKAKKKRRRQISSDEDEEDELMATGGEGDGFIDEREDSSNLSKYNSEESEDEPMYKLRARRATKSFDFKEYDELINSALRDEDEYEVAEEGGAGGVPSEKAHENGDAEEHEPPPPKLVVSKGKVMPGTSDGEEEEEEEAQEKHEDSSEADEVDEDEKKRRQELEKQSHRKTRRRLNDLDATSDEDSDEDFKGSEDEDEEEDEAYAVEDEDSEWSGDREGEESDDSIAKRGKKSGKLGRQEKYLDVGSVRRSTRKARSRIVYDESDQEDDEDEPAEGWGSENESEASSASESDDATWGKQKKKKKAAYNPPSKFRKSDFIFPTGKGGSKKTDSKSKLKSSGKKKKKKVDEDETDRAWSKHGGKVKKGDTEFSNKRSTRGKKIDFKVILDSGESDDDGNIHPKRVRPVVPDYENDVEEPSSSKQLVAELNAAQAQAASKKKKRRNSKPNSRKPSPAAGTAAAGSSPTRKTSLSSEKSPKKKKPVKNVVSSSDDSGPEPEPITNSKLAEQLLKPIPAPPIPPNLAKRLSTPSALPPGISVPLPPQQQPQDAEGKTVPPVPSPSQIPSTQQPPPPQPPAAPFTQPPLTVVSQPSTNLMMSEILASSGSKKQHHPLPRHPTPPPSSPGGGLPPAQVQNSSGPKAQLAGPPIPGGGPMMFPPGKVTSPHRGLSSPPHQAHSLLPPSEISRVPNPAYYPPNQGMRFPWERNLGLPPYQGRGPPPQSMVKSPPHNNSPYPAGGPPQRSGYVPPPPLRIPNPGGSPSGPPLQSFQQFKRDSPGPGPQMMYGPRMPPQGNGGGRGLPPPNILAHLQSSHERFFAGGGFGGPPPYGLPPPGPLYSTTQPQQFDYRHEDSEFKEEVHQPERRASPPPPVSKEENKSDGEFGGLVSYFSSQRGEEDMDT